MTEANPEQGLAHTAELEEWLASTFRAENALLRERLQTAVWAQLDLHNKNLSAAFAARLRGGVGLSSDASAAKKARLAPCHHGPAGAPEDVGHRSSEGTTHDLVTAANDAGPAKWQAVYDKARPRRASDSFIHAVERAVAVKEAATERVVARKQKPQGECDSPDAASSRASAKGQTSLFPEHLHTHQPVTIDPSLHKTLEVLKGNLEGMRRSAPSGVVEKKTYHTAKVRELAGQGSELTHGHSLGLVSRFVRSNHFEFCSAIVILACTVLMIVEIQYAGYNSGFDLGVPGFNTRATEKWPGAEDVFEALNMAFNIVFLVELLLRIVVHRLECVWNAWIYFDFFLVTCGWLDGLGLLEFGLDPMILRVARLTRLLRLLKALRAVRALETLFLLVRSLQASFGALFWSFALLWVLQVVTGILLCQLLRDFIDDDTKDNEEARRQVFDYFGTFLNATVTMFEITLANWVTSCRVLYTHVSIWYGMFVLFYRGCFMFAVIKVITAVFLAETARCANSDDNIAVQLKQKQKETYCRKMATVFMELDESHDGYLSAEEFAPIMTDDLLKTWLTTLEIDTQDLDHLFEILDNGDAMIDLDEFTRGMTRIRGPAKSIDVLKLQVATSQLGKKLDALLQSPPLCAPDPPADLRRACDLEFAGDPGRLQALVEAAEPEAPADAPETLSEPLSERCLTETI